MKWTNWGWRLIAYWAFLGCIAPAFLCFLGRATSTEYLLHVGLGALTGVLTCATVEGLRHVFRVAVSFAGRDWPPWVGAIVGLIAGGVVGYLTPWVLTGWRVAESQLAGLAILFLLTTQVAAGGLAGLVWGVGSVVRTGRGSNRDGATS